MAGVCYFTLARAAGGPQAATYGAWRPMSNVTTLKPAKGRSGSQSRKKQHQVTTGYDDVEYAELCEAASRSGLTLASYQRVQSLGVPRTRSTRRPPVDRELLARAVGQIGKIGSNLNQLTHTAHLNPSEQIQAGALFGAIDAALAALMEALGRKPAEPVAAALAPAIEAKAPVAQDENTRRVNTPPPVSEPSHMSGPHPGAQPATSVPDANFWAQRAAAAVQPSPPSTPFGYGNGWRMSGVIAPQQQPAPAKPKPLTSSGEDQSDPVVERIKGYLERQAKRERGEP